MSPLRISLCMIVKNEADCIGRCLESVKQLVDEMIVVDTGSTDGTDEICRKLGANVYPFQWNKDFSEARNYSLSLAQGDWILWLDADEEIEPETDSNALRELADSNQFDMYTFRLNNYYGASPDRHNIIHIAHLRLFRNRIGFQFHGRIHETLNVNEVLPDTDDQKRIGHAPITIWHYGYLDKYVKMKGKADRNVSLLNQALEEDEENPWLHYHLASEYYRVQKFSHSFQHANRSIVLFIMANLTPPSLLYKLKYSILLSLGSFEGAYPAIDKAIALYPDYVDLIFYKAVILLYLNKPAEAIGALDRCLEIGEGHLKHLTQRGLGSFQAWYYKGLCYEKLDDLKMAALSYKNCIKLCPEHETAQAALLRLEHDSK